MRLLQTVTAENVQSSAKLRDFAPAARSVLSPAQPGVFSDSDSTHRSGIALRHSEGFSRPYLGFVGFRLRIGVAGFEKSPLLNRRACRFSPGRTIMCDPSACSTRMGLSPVL
jgi:hypothetical protein